MKRNYEDMYRYVHALEMLVLLRVFALREARSATVWTVHLNVAQQLGGKCAAFAYSSRPAAGDDEFEETCTDGLRVLPSGSIGRLEFIYVSTAWYPRPKAIAIIAAMLRYHSSLNHAM